MNKNIPIPKNEKERLIALKSYQIMDTLPEEVYTNVTELAAIICGTPIVLISLLDEERQWIKAGLGLGAREIPRALSFCQHTIMGDEIFEVSNAMENPTFSSNPLVTGDPTVRFYAGTPLTNEEGYTLGTLCVLDTEPKKLTEDQKKALTLLGNEVTSHLSSRRRALENKGIEDYFDKAMDMICIAAQDGYFKNVNPRFSEILGFSKCELLSKPYLDFIHPDDLDSTYRMLEELANGIPLVEFTNRLMCKDGSFKKLSWNSGVEKETGNMYAMARDITIEEANFDRILLESKVIKIIAENEGVMDTLTKVGRLICSHLEWQMGTLWEVSKNQKKTITPLFLIILIKIFLNL